MPGWHRRRSDRRANQDGALNTLLVIGVLALAGGFLVRGRKQRKRRRARGRWLAGIVLLAGVAMFVFQDRGTMLARKLPANVATARSDIGGVAQQRRTTSAPAPLSGSVLNDAGFARIRSGDYRGALPLLDQAVRRLRSTGSIVEAYALYNLAVARFALGRCDGVLSLLDRSQARQGRRTAIDRLREQARARCGS